MTLRAVIFDWGGTITPWHRIDLESQWYAFAQNYDPTNAAALAKDLYEAEESRWMIQRDTRGGESTGALTSIFQSCGVDMNAPQFQFAFEQYLEFWKPHTYADPDALPLFRALKERGVLVGVLSNTMWSREHHEHILERDGLLEFIAGGVYTSELSVAKPHKDAFLAAVAAVGVEDPRDVVFVGDRLFDDIHGAQSVGMRAIFLPHSDHRDHELVEVENQPDAVIQKLGDVFNLVRQWQKSEFNN
ncbi:MAG: hypothetical protein RLZZ426_634 [Actinomycetota bacterium]|jgi:putative hydrolase of the HAD superfamily